MKTQYDFRQAYRAGYAVGIKNRTTMDVCPYASDSIDNAYLRECWIEGFKDGRFDLSLDNLEINNEQN